MAVKQLDTEKYLPDPQAAIDMIYGEFGGGKNTYAARIARKALNKGIPVFSSFPINFEGYNELDNPFKVFIGMLGLKRIYKYIPKENFRRLTLQEIASADFVNKLLKMHKCLVIIDEGYASALFDSYKRTNVTVDARMAIFTTRHFDRRFLIVAQRPNSIHVNARGMVNRFYNCWQPLGDGSYLSKVLWRLTRHRWFIITEYQHMLNDTVDEEKPRRHIWLWSGLNELQFFNSKYMAEGYKNEYPSLMKVYKIGTLSLWQGVFSRRRFSAGGRT